MCNNVIIVIKTNGKQIEYRWKVQFAKGCGNKYFSDICLTIKKKERKGKEKRSFAINMINLDRKIYFSELCER